MSLAAKLRRAPGRIATGVFILDQGLTKIRADEETAKHLHSAAAESYPIFAKMQPRTFVTLLGTTEIGLGTVLLLPLFPTRLAGLGLMGFSGSLLGMWWRLPGTHERGSVKPTPEGIPAAKDVWMFGIGLGLVIDSLSSRSRKPTTAAASTSS